MHKKGFFMVYLLIFTIIALGIAFYFWAAVTDKYEFIEELGDFQHSFLSNSNEIYEELYFRNEALNYAAESNFINFINSGGSSYGATADGYGIWFFEGEEYWPDGDELTETYFSLVEQDLNNYSINSHPVFKISPSEAGLELIGDLASDNIELIYHLNVSKMSIAHDHELYSNYTMDLVYDSEYNFRDFLTKVVNMRNFYEESKLQIDKDRYWRDKESLSWVDSVEIELNTVDGDKVYKFRLISDIGGGKEAIVKCALIFN